MCDAAAQNVATLLSVLLLRFLSGTCTPSRQNMRFVRHPLLALFIFFNFIRPARDKEGQRCNDQNGVTAIRAETVQIPPGFVVYVENNINLSINSGIAIGDAATLALCVNVTFKQDPIKCLICKYDIEDILCNSIRYTLLKDNKSGKWILEAFHLTSADEEITYCWFDDDSNTKLGQNTVIVRERRSSNITVIGKEHSNISVVTHIHCEKAVDVAYKNGNTHHFDFALEGGNATGCNVYTSSYSLSFAFYYLSFNVWNVTGDLAGMHTLAVAGCNNFTTELSVKLEVIEGSKKDTTKPGSESSDDIDDETVWCSCINGTQLLLPFNVESEVKGKGIYRVKSNGTFLIWSADHRNAEDSIEYVCQLPENCVYSANETLGRGMTAGGSSVTVPVWVIPVAIIVAVIFGIGIGILLYKMKDCLWNKLDAEGGT
ncbi:uncharacterized protein [Ptychodera flava]|uniref:uncharacterized protein isoform X2 n=2 Tax=Ptychodera flava TaxID=63121 RepID=UPI00396A2C3F